ncbi:hypothetical protein TTHERM_00320000 (macronuclear) [Tetrahymena thermophila SB210]|uniref:Uncharacterized protein n=1 Tax=Tetrahymena thermophila (strain SB210) TaxID=312017 RepID=Q237T5_TETTS|nr:hypothetical protein TTHERM_00320000 [Tetrahymena thermophila SB210]EAR92656.1 hypothetical protein TTHERM_00320000 [Tetrahymena thermophila SB210]|eukprot:XP_001012901.1 hypothetical protein TTHERM_00320000 [Tetrahymena thermophila SB210]
MNITNQVQNPLLIQQRDMRQPLQKQFNQQNSQLVNYSTASKQSQVSSPKEIIKNNEDTKQKCLSGEECFRQRRIQIQNQQLLNQQKNILDEFIKYNQNIQKTSDEYISQRKQWNKSFDLSKNKKIISIKGQEEEQNIITIAQYMVNNSNKSFEEQLNNSIHPSLRSSPKNENSKQKENQNPISQQVIQLPQDKKQTEPEQMQKQNTPLKIYKNNKIYKNQYAQKIQNEGSIMQQSLQISYEKSTPKAIQDGQDNFKIKYIQTDLNTYKLTPQTAVQNNKLLNKGRYDGNDKRQRASSVTNKRTNSQLGQPIRGSKKQSIKSRLNSDSYEIQTENSNKLPEIFQFEEVPQIAQNQINTPKSISSNIASSKPIESLQDTGVKLSTYNQNYSTKSSYRQKDSADSMCQTEPNDQYKITKLNENQNHSTEPDSSFLLTEYKVYNSKSQYKNHGRRFRSQSRASSQMSENIAQTNQVSPTSLGIENQKQMEHLIKTEDVSIGSGQKNQYKQNIVQPQQNQTQLISVQNNQFYQYYYDRGNNLNQTQLLHNKLDNSQEQNKKYLIGSIIRKEQENQVQKAQNNTDQSKLMSTNNQSSLNPNLQNENNSSQPIQIETDLAAYQYIEKLKREKRLRQEEDYKKFLAEKQKMNDQFNEFCIKKQLTNSIINQSVVNNESQAMTNPSQIYQYKNQQRMIEISNKCQQIYEECLSQLQISPQVFQPQQLNQQQQAQQNVVFQKNNIQDSHPPKNIQIDPVAITLPRLSPINSTTNNSTKFQNEEQRSISYQRAVNPTLNSVFQSQTKSTRSNSNQPSMIKPNNSKPITISMQKFLNDSSKGISDKQYFPSKKKLESSSSRASSQLESSIIINQIDEQIKHQSPQKLTNESIKFQSSKKKVIKIKNHSTLLENKDSLSSQKKQNTIKANNSLDVVQGEKSNKTENQNKILKNNQKDPKDDPQFATKIDLNLNQPLQKNKNLESINIQQNNQTPTKNILSPKSILKSPKNYCESSSIKNIKEPQDFTLGYDSQIQFFDQTQMPASQPTIYSNLNKRKNTKNDLSPTNQNVIQAHSHKQILPKTQFLREEELNQQIYQKFSQLQETDAFYRVQTNSVDNSIKYSQDFGQILSLNESNNEDSKNQLSPISNKYSVQINQITEVSNTEDELSQQNTRNLIKGCNQGSKFTFLNCSSPDIQDHAKEGLTSFSQKILQPMQIMHQSKILQDSQSPSQIRQNLIDQLSNLNQKSSLQNLNVSQKLVKTNDENKNFSEKTNDFQIQENQILSPKTKNQVDNQQNDTNQMNDKKNNTDSSNKLQTEQTKISKQSIYEKLIEKNQNKFEQIQQNYEKQSQQNLLEQSQNDQKTKQLIQEPQEKQFVEIINTKSGQQDIQEAESSQKSQKQNKVNEGAKQNQIKQNPEQIDIVKSKSNLQQETNHVNINNDNLNQKQCNLKESQEIDIQRSNNLQSIINQKILKNRNKNLVNEQYQHLESKRQNVEQNKQKYIEESQFVIELDNDTNSNRAQSPKQIEDQQTNNQLNEQKVNIYLNSRDVPLIINSSFY